MHVPIPGATWDYMLRCHLSQEPPSSYVSCARVRASARGTHAHVGGAPDPEHHLSASVASDRVALAATGK